MDGDQDRVFRRLDLPGVSDVPKARHDHIPPQAAEERLRFLAVRDGTGLRLVRLALPGRCVTLQRATRLICDLTSCRSDGVLDDVTTRLRSPTEARQ